jgi:hypothetical protein
VAAPWRVAAKAGGALINQASLREVGADHQKAVNEPFGGAAIDATTRP